PHRGNANTPITKQGKANAAGIQRHAGKQIKKNPKKPDQEKPTAVGNQTNKPRARKPKPKKAIIEPHPPKAKTRSNP
ncbi:hypothetical protein PQR05_33965, partial [Paraburkholderia sediminicola]|uniref:hypothetical protein n=1 Tax=Paraburkholderia sediminicola TaxID=458836 RepID=UPI0038BB1441